MFDRSKNPSDDYNNRNESNIINIFHSQLLLLVKRIMFSLEWIFIGVVTGLLMVSVFIPPSRKEPRVPTPNTKQVYKTSSGCVKFKTHEVPCSQEAMSLNLVASQHK
jgi:hypothetical protein